MVIVLLVLSPAVAAAESPGDCDATSQAIDATLAHEAHRVAVWRWSWGIVAGVGTAAQVGVAVATDERDLRIDMVVGAVSTLGLFLGVAFPPEIEPTSRVATCPDRQADAEHRLARAARNQRSARSPWLHVANAVFNVGVGLVLGLGYGHWTSGAISAVAGFAIGEVQLFTIPNGAPGAVPTVIAPGRAPASIGLSFQF